MNPYARFMNRGLLVLALLAVPYAGVAQTRAKPASAARAKATADDHLYRNAIFGFRYLIPYGWVDRTKEMREPEAADTQPEAPDTKEKPPAAKPATGELLLGVFERPPEATGDSINSAVVIASESVAAYPGLKKAEDYVGPLTELTTSKGFKLEGEPVMIDIDSKALVRVDFSKHLTDALTMHQSTLVLLAKGRVVSFTFVGSDGNEVDDLIDGLHFGVTKPTRP